MERTYINDTGNLINSISDFPDIALSKLRGKFFYYRCTDCGEIKSKRIYIDKGSFNVDFICRECKYRNTSIERYGTANPTNSKSSIEKRNATMLERYGTLSTTQFIDYSKVDFDSRNKKTEATNLKKYGVRNVSQAKEVQDKIRATNMERYGGVAPACSSEIVEKQKATILEKYGSYSNMPGPKSSHEKFVKYRMQETDSLDLTWNDSDSFRGKYDNGPIYYSFTCNKCGITFLDDFHSGVPVCRKCSPNMANTSHQEIELADYISSIYNGTVLLHDRNVLNGKELDVYLPDIKTAFEYNGTYWHGYRKDTKISLSEFKKKIEEKRLMCESLGIRLISIDEADYQGNPDVYKRFIQDVVLPRKRIFARKCDVREISTEDARDFCEYYHINGYRGGNTKLGLFYGDELLVVAVFGKHQKYQNECIRLVYKTGYDVIGGWAKIVAHFGKPFLHYVNLKYFRGENKTGCGYRFWICKRLVARQQLQGDGLKNYCKDIDPNVSDFQNCLMNNGIAVFDVGNDIRLYNFPEEK